MKSVRKQNPVLFDLILFLLFCGASFAAYFLAERAGDAGGIVAIATLAAISLALVLSR